MIVRPWLTQFSFHFLLTYKKINKWKRLNRTESLCLFVCFFYLFTFLVIKLIWNIVVWQLRRERIAERMKALQELVPNANKVNNQWILNYVVFGSLY